MTPVMEWDINDVESLIKNQVQENLNLDYKRSISLENNDKTIIHVLSILDSTSKANPQLDNTFFRSKPTPLPFTCLLLICVFPIFYEVLHSLNLRRRFVKPIQTDSARAAKPTFEE